jgi:hypothetical protein
MSELTPWQGFSAESLAVNEHYMERLLTDDALYGRQMDQASEEKPEGVSALQADLRTFRKRRLRGHLILSFGLLRERPVSGRVRRE